MPKWCRHSTRMSATDVRELVSSAMRPDLRRSAASCTARPTRPARASRCRRPARSGSRVPAGTRSTEPARDRPRPPAAARTDRRHVVADVPALRRRDRAPRSAAGRSDSRPRRCGAPSGEHTRTRPSRSTGSNPAASMLRRISSSGARRRPSGASSDADTPSMSSAPNVSATCASFGP